MMNGSVMVAMAFMGAIIGWTIASLLGGEELWQFLGPVIGLVIGVFVAVKLN